MSEPVVETPPFVPIEMPADTFVEPEPAPKKRKRKQEKPKQLIDADGKSEVVVGKAISKKLKQIEEDKQRMKSVLSYVNKTDKKKAHGNIIADERFQKDLNDPSILKSYSLNAFYFLGVSELEVINVAEFKDYFLQTNDTLLKLEKMEKNLEAYDLSQDEFRKLFLKYGKQYFKINERDYSRLKQLHEMLLELKQDSKDDDLRIRAYLTDIVKSTFADKNEGGGMITCLSPKLRFEISN
jgi:hypothetical protein